MLNQKEAVYTAITSLFGEDHENPLQLDTEERKQVVTEVITMFEAGTVSLSHPVEFKKYVPGLVNNWLRKDKRINGGETYRIKNPGSREGAGDKKLKNLKKMLGIVKEEDKAKVQAAITTRTDQIKLEKQKDVEIDASQIPEDLQHLLADSTETTEE